MTRTWSCGSAWRRRGWRCRHVSCHWRSCYGSAAGSLPSTSRCRFRTGSPPTCSRFDTRFFIAHMPPRQSALHCTIETSEGIWLRPTDLLDGTYPVVYATAQHLRRLLPYASIAELLEFAQHKLIRRVQPEVRDTSGG